MSFQLNNITFYCGSYTFSADVGNKGIKLAGQDRNIVLNLGRDIAILNMEAYCENSSNFFDLKREFATGNLCTLTLNDGSVYYAYPDTFTVERRANDPLRAETTDWRTLEMSFLIPDVVIYGSANCTSFNLSSDSPTTGILKNISIGGAADTPLSIRLTTYNASKQSIEIGASAGWKEFGEPEYAIIPSQNITFYYMSPLSSPSDTGWCDEGLGWYRRYAEYERYESHFDDICETDSDYSFIKISSSTFKDELDATALVDLGTYGFIGYKYFGQRLESNNYWIYNYCDTHYVVVLKLDFKADVGTYSISCDPRLGKDGWDYSCRVKVIVGTGTSNIDLERGGNSVREGEFSLNNGNISSNGFVTGGIRIYVCEDDREFDSGHGYAEHTVSIPPISISDYNYEMSFIRIQQSRHPKLGFKFETSDLSIISDIIVNGTVFRSSIENNPVIKIYGSNQRYTFLGSTYLGGFTVDKDNFGTNTIIPFNVDVSDYEYADVVFTSDKVESYVSPSSDADLKYNDSQPKFGVELFCCVDNILVEGYSMWDSENTYYESSGKGFGNMNFMSTLSQFDIWNSQNEEAKFELGGLILGEYHFNYLENSEFKFVDNFDDSNLIAGSYNAGIGTNNLSIGTNGYVYYNMGFGIPLMEEPYILMKYATAPSSIEIISNTGDSYTIDIPSNNITSKIYNVGYSLVTRNDMKLKINGPANISSIEIFGISSNYLFGLPDLNPGNNIIEYEVGGNYSNINGTLCWREAAY